VGSASAVGIRLAVVLALAVSLAPAAGAEPGVATGSISYQSRGRLITV
jgi:hypothetical protein